jgi:hypothetical protein
MPNPASCLFPAEALSKHSTRKPGWT